MHAPGGLDLLHPDVVQPRGIVEVVILGLEGEHTRQHHKQEHASRPNVHLLAVIARPGKGVRRRRKGRACVRVRVCERVHESVYLCLCASVCVCAG